MNRRNFLQHTGKSALMLTLLGQGCISNSKHQTTYSPTSHLLSVEGCGRATGYAEANKIISWKNKTHVSWLESGAEGFHVKFNN